MDQVKKPDAPGVKGVLDRDSDYGSSKPLRIA
jgi:hypothetical protein